jgi:DNA-directed RNA polymerase subunit E'/Rpb7
MEYRYSINVDTLEIKQHQVKKVKTRTLYVKDNNGNWIIKNKNNYFKSIEGIRIHMKSLWIPKVMKLESELLHLKEKLKNIENIKITKDGKAD